MLAFLHRWSIPTRLYFQLTIVVSCTVLLIFYSMSTLYKDLEQSKINSSKDMVQTIYSLVDAQYKRSQTGDITEEQAKQNSLDIIKDLRYENGGYYWVYDTDLNMVMHPVKPELNGRNLLSINDVNGKAFHHVIQQKIRDNGEGYVDYYWPVPGSEESTKKISYFKAYENWNFILATGVYVKDIEQTYWLNGKVKLLFGALITLFIAATAFLISTSITKPLNKMVVSLEKATSTGDLTQRLSSKGNDEIAKLAKSFNTYTEQVHNFVSETSSTTKSIVESSDRSSEVSNEISQFLNEQDRETNAVAHSIEIMSASTSEVSDNASDAADAALKANTICHEAKTVVSGGIKSVEVLVDKVSGASGVINGLQDDVNEIVTVLEVIRGIAEQTNLLALNAAIEAARAGEQGRGFAVVADEVRTLASRTQDSTQEIQNTIERLKEGSDKAVKVMSVSQSVGEETLKSTIEAGKSLDEISSEVETITGMNTKIAEAVTQQNTTVESINVNIKTIKDNASKNENMSEVTRNTAKVLSDNADKLSGLISKFKVS